MKVSALLTSVGINIALCVVLLSLYSILRKQPGNFSVYFGRKLARERKRQKEGHFSFERFVPPPSWLVKAWGYTEDEILATAGLDAVVFLRILVFSIQIFSVSSFICILFVLPVNYLGQDGPHLHIRSENLDVFTIANVEKGSHWLWVHCVALYIISCFTCVLLYVQYRSIARMRLSHIAASPPNPCHFTVLVRSIPKPTEESLSESVKSFFSNYHASTYLSHQMIYRTGKVQKIMKNAENMYKNFVQIEHVGINQTHRHQIIKCDLCRSISNSVQLTCRQVAIDTDKSILEHEDSNTKKECTAAFVFFKNRYAAVVASQVLQTSNPMLWVTDLAPESRDVYWSNLWIPYEQLWMRRIAILIVSIVFMFLFFPPVTFVQGLSELEQLQQMFPFLRKILRTTFVSQVVTGYLPSVILMLFLYIVPPTMMLFSSIEGPISYSARKKSACCKVLYFTIWNVFFANVFSGSIISQINAISVPKDIPNQLAKAVPRQATFFITYVLTSGWASLSSEIVQLFPLAFNLIKKHICRTKVDADSIPSFPYHTEVPRVVLFGLIGFVCSILAPLILPFLLVYFSLGYIVYKNQIMNVYCSKYETWGQMWPIVHNTVIFSLVLAQIIALGVFSIRDSPVTSGFAIPLVIITLLFNAYCRKRFYPIFKNVSAQELINMDREDEQMGRVEAILMELQNGYCQFPQKEEIALSSVETDSNKTDGNEKENECSVQVNLK